MRHAPIPPVTYQPPEGKAGEVEVVRVSMMLERAGPAAFAHIQRPEFHALLALDEGRGRHMLDFVEYEVVPGSLLWIRPGQVHRWGDVTAYDGWVIIFPVGLLDPETGRLTEAESPRGPCFWPPPAFADANAELLIDVFARTNEKASLPRTLRSPTLTHLLAALLLELAGAAGTRPDSGAGSEPWRAFRDLVEEHHTRQHQVSWYARRLGWSERTLARATRSATGRTPKEVIDERVMLEAKRLLAHTDLSAARVAAQTGFADPANFGAWFRTRSGLTPRAFRRQLRD